MYPELGKPVHEIDRLALWTHKNVHPVLAEPYHPWAGHPEVVAVAGIDAPNSTDIQVVTCESLIDRCDFSRAEVGMLVVDAGKRNPERAAVAFKDKHFLNRENMRMVGFYIYCVRHREGSDDKAVLD